MGALCLFLVLCLFLWVANSSDPECNCEMNLRELEKTVKYLNDTTVHTHWKLKEFVDLQLTVDKMRRTIQMQQEYITRLDIRLGTLLAPVQPLGDDPRGDQRGIEITKDFNNGRLQIREAEDLKHNMTVLMERFSLEESTVRILMEEVAEIQQNNKKLQDELGYERRKRRSLESNLLIIQEEINETNVLIIPQVEIIREKINELEKNLIGIWNANLTEIKIKDQLDAFLESIEQRLELSGNALNRPASKEQKSKLEYTLLTNNTTNSSLDKNTSVLPITPDVGTDSQNDDVKTMELLKDMVNKTVSSRLMAIESTSATDIGQQLTDVISEVRSMNLSVQQQMGEIRQQVESLQRSGKLTDDSLELLRTFCMALHSRWAVFVDESKWNQSFITNNIQDLVLNVSRINDKLHVLQLETNATATSPYLGEHLVQFVMELASNLSMIKDSNEQDHDVMKNMTILIRDKIVDFYFDLITYRRETENLELEVQSVQEDINEMRNVVGEALQLGQVTAWLTDRVANVSLVIDTLGNNSEFTGLLANEWKSIVTIRFQQEEMQRAISNLSRDLSSGLEELERLKQTQIDGLQMDSNESTLVLNPEVTNEPQLVISDQDKGERPTENSVSLPGTQSPIGRSCLVQLPRHGKVVMSYNGRELNSQINIPDGKQVVFRCQDIGRYILDGDSRISCVDGTWYGKLPTCQETMDESMLIAITHSSTPFCPEPKGLFPHPTSCHKFISCWSNRWVIQECPKGLRFSPSGGYCDLPHLIDCPTDRNDLLKEIPTIQIHPLPFTANSGISLTDDGKLAVQPGSTFQLRCLYPRVLGDPTWHRPPQTGTTTSWISIQEGNPDRDYQFAVMVQDADEQHSGTYTCVSPQGGRNEIEVVVKDVLCPAVVIPEGSPLKTTQNQPYNRSLTSFLQFSCQGRTLQGAATISCLASGRWSEDLPFCNLKVFQIGPLTIWTPSINLK